MERESGYPLASASYLRVRGRDSSFAERLRAIRDAWRIDREMAELSRQHDRLSQLRAMDVLYTWIGDAIADVRSVFRESVEIEISSCPTGEEQEPQFSASISPGYELVVTLLAKEGEGGRRWHIAVATRSGPGAPLRPAGPDRRHTAWSRGRVEDLVLSLLSAAERARWSHR